MLISQGSYFLFILLLISAYSDVELFESFGVCFGELVDHCLVLSFVVGFDLLQLFLFLTHCKAKLSNPTILLLNSLMQLHNLTTLIQKLPLLLNQIFQLLLLPNKLSTQSLILHILILQLNPNNINLIP